MQTDLKQLQKVEIEILDKIDEICKENNIKYFLIGGTLLGAVRHKGFIPWDDDIDIGMMREDYDKFIKLCMNGALGEKYYLHCDESDKNYFISFAKVRKNNTTFLEPYLKDINTHKGIFVDIFPYDHVPSANSLAQKIQAIFVKSIIDTIYVKHGVYSLNNVRRKYLVAIFKIFPTKFLKLIKEKVSKIYNKKTNEYITCFPGTYGYIEETLRKDRVFPLKKVNFEGKEYYGMKDNDYYLTKQYGDYMKLPKEEDRKTHMPEYINFKEGENRINEN